MKKFLKIMFTMLISAMVVVNVASCGGGSNNSSSENGTAELLFAGLEATDIIPVEETPIGRKKALAEDYDKNIIKSTPKSVYNTSRLQKEWLIIYLIQPEDIYTRHEILRITVKYPNGDERNWNASTNETNEDPNSREWYITSDDERVYIPITTSSALGEYTYEVKAITYIDHTDGSTIKNVANLNGDYENTIIFKVGYKAVRDKSAGNLPVGTFTRDPETDNIIVDTSQIIENVDQIPLQSVEIYGRNETSVTIDSPATVNSGNYDVFYIDIEKLAELNIHDIAIIELSLKYVDDDPEGYVISSFIIESTEYTDVNIEGGKFPFLSGYFAADWYDDSGIYKIRRVNAMKIQVKYGWELEFINLSNMDLWDEESLLTLQIAEDITISASYLDGFSRINIWSKSFLANLSDSQYPVDTKDITVLNDAVLFKPSKNNAILGLAAVLIDVLNVDINSSLTGVTLIDQPIGENVSCYLSLNELNGTISKT